MSTAVTYASKNSVERVRRLLKENPNFVYWKGGHDGHTFLHRAVMEFGEGSVEVRAELVKLLLANGADVNAKTNSGVTPLHWAAHWPWKDMVELLLTNGADVNARDEDGHRPSYFAAKFGRWDLVEILRRHGDDDPFLSFQSLQGNLDLWKSSAEPSEWVQKHRGGWSHNYWLELLASLRTSRYWPMDEAQIGRYLELLRTVFSEEQGAPDPAYSNEVHRLASALLLGGHSAFRSWPGVASGQQRLAAEEAAVALQQIGGEEAYLALARALGCGWYGMGWEESQGHCNNVLKAAYDAILALGLRAVPTLIRVLGNPTSDTRRVAAELLYELGEKRWYSLIKGEDEDIHRLGSCGDPRAVTSLLEALALGYEKAAAARFLGQIGDRRAIKPLLDMQTEVRGTRYADDDDARVVTEALRLLTS